MGVVENMSWLENGITRELIFGSGGAAKVAEQLTSAAGYPVEVLVQIPLNQSLAESSDQGMPLILKDFEDSASKELQKLVRTVAAVKLGKAARTLTVKLGQ
jgi:ATP-binding protein involved in chromosome partitioning